MKVGGDFRRQFIVFILTEVSTNNSRIILDGFRIAISNLLSVIKDDHMIGNLHDDAHIMFDQQKADSLIIADAL